MKRLAAAIGAAALLTVLPAAAQAKKCGTGCLRNEVKALQKSVKALEGVVKTDSRYVATFSKCVKEVPVTEYGEPSKGNGYVYDPGTGASDFEATALDGTAAGGAVSVWELIDACNTTKTAPSSSASMTRSTEAFGVFGPLWREYTIPTFTR